MNSCLFTLVVTGLTLLLFSTIGLYAQTRLGLQLTQVELDIWRERTEKGPFKSRGEYARIPLEIVSLPEIVILKRNHCVPGIRL